MQMTTEQFEKLLAQVDWYYHYLERGYMGAKRHYDRVASLAEGNPEWKALWNERKPSNV